VGGGVLNGELRLLGPVELDIAGRAHPLGGPIARLVFVQLAIADHRHATDVQLQDAVWGDWAPDSADVALRVHVTRLRTAIRPLGWEVERRHGGYALTTGDLAVDETQLTDDEAAARRSAGREALVHTERSLARWRGPSLADLRRLPLGDRLAVGLDRRREALELRRDELLVETGRSADAVAQLERALTNDPEDVARWRLFVLAVADLDGPEPARAALARAHRTCPSVHRRFPDLAGMLDARPRREQVTRPAGAGVAVPFELAAQRAEPLVGRDDVLAELLAQLDAPTSRVLRLTGPAGVGKTALAAEVAARCASTGRRVSYGWADEYVTASFMPIWRALGSGGTGGPGTEARRTAAPEAATDVAPDRTDDPGSIQQRAILVETSLRRLRGLAAHTPTLVILDDIQWADDLTLALLKRLARHPVPEALQVLVIERDTSASRLPSGSIHDVEVLPLASDAISELTHTTGVELEHLVELSEGLPLLLVDALRRSAGDAKLDEHISRRLGEGLRGLEARARSTLSLAAVLGMDVPFDRLARLVTTRVLDVLEDLDEGITRGVLRVARDRPDHYRFRHGLLRDALLEALSPLHRAELNRHVLTTLDDELGPLARLHHTTEAELVLGPLAVADAAVVAGRALIAALAFDDARAAATAGVGALQRSTECSPAAATATNASDATSAMLHAILARAFAGLGRFDDARGHLDRAMTLAHTTGDPFAEGYALESRMLFGTRFVADPFIEERLSRVIDELPRTDPLRSSLLRQLAFERFNRGAVDAAAAAISAARDVSGPLATAALLQLEYRGYEILGDVTRRRRTAKDLAELAAANDTHGIADRALDSGLNEALHDGDRSRMVALAEELVESGRRFGDPHSEWLGMVARFPGLLSDGDLDGAAAAAAGALSWGREAGVIGAWGTFASQSFAIGWVRGELAEFVGPLRSVKVTGPDLVWRSALALALTFTDDGAEEAASELLRLADEVTGAAYHWLGWVGVAVGTEAAYRAGAPEFAAAAEPLLRRRSADHVILGNSAIDYGPVERYLALAEAVQGRTDDAAKRLERVAADRRSGAVWASAAAGDLQKLTTGAPHDT
jgi:tetratricopeptide (TPR) repeat protein/DNA-binding SARP family transcriptional activator